jgi:hypothetical protein
MTKAQKKAMEVAAQHYQAGNHASFNAQVLGLIRCAMKESQIEAIKVAAYDIQFGGRV